VYVFILWKHIGPITTDLYVTIQWANLKPKCVVQLPLVSILIVLDRTDKIKKPPQTKQRPSSLLLLPNKSNLDYGSTTAITIMPNNHNLEGLDSDEGLNNSRDDHDDEGYESDPLVLDDEKDHNAKSKKTKHDVINWTYERQDDSDAVMCNWVGMIVMLGIFVAASFLYWNHTKHHFNGNNDLSAEGLTAGNIRTRPPRPRAGKSHNNDDDATNDDNTLDTDGKPWQGTFFFDPFAAIHTSNPLDFSSESVEEYYAQTLVSPVWGPLQDSAGNNNSNDSNDDNRLGYMMEPNIVNGTVAFVCEGDLYLASWRTPTPPPSSSSSISAMKLTTTIGNVRNPKINPVYAYFIAYTATYTGRRDVYLLDLRRRTHGSQPAMRLTYWSNGPAGVRGLVVSFLFVIYIHRQLLW